MSIHFYFGGYLSFEKVSLATDAFAAKLYQFEQSTVESDAAFNWSCWQDVVIN